VHAKLFKWRNYASPFAVTFPEDAVRRLLLEAVDEGLPDGRGAHQDEADALQVRGGDGRVGGAERHQWGGEEQKVGLKQVSTEISLLCLCTARWKL
jgi:hypothetical protein